jgi:hypothetical protein
MKVRITLTLDVEPDKYQVQDWVWSKKPSQLIVRESIKGDLITSISDAIDTPENRDYFGIQHIQFL